jgi:hypothetical protein
MEMSQQGEKRALVVGIDDYGSPVNDLPSCINDARRFAETLQSVYAFQRSKIVTLFDREATKTNVVTSLQSIFEGIQADDRVVFYFSGHGYRLSEGEDLEDALVLNPSGGSDFFMTGSELSALTQKVPSGVLTVVLDSCFSGGMDKALFVLPAIGPSDIAMVKSYIPTRDTPTERIDRKAYFSGAETVAQNSRSRRLHSFSGVQLHSLMGMPKAMGSSDTSLQNRSLNGILLAACQLDEKAAASNSTTNGNSAFTFCLLDCITGNSAMASRTVAEAVSKKIRDLGFTQQPQLALPAEPEAVGAKSFILLGSASTGPLVQSDRGEDGVPSDQVSLIFHILETIVNLANNATVNSGVNKDFLNDLIKTAGVLSQFIPKDFRPTGVNGSTSKDFFGDLVNAANVVGQFIPKDFRATGVNGSTGKDFFGDLVNAANVVGQFIPKDYRPNPTQSTVDSKDFNLGDVVNTLQTVATIASIFA